MSKHQLLDKKFVMVDDKKKNAEIEKEYVTDKFITFFHLNHFSHKVW